MTQQRVLLEVLFDLSKRQLIGSSHRKFPTLFVVHGFKLQLGCMPIYTPRSRSIQVRLLSLESLDDHERASYGGNSHC